jgi:hypothetical protein
VSPQHLLRPVHSSGRQCPVHSTGDKRRACPFHWQATRPYCRQAKRLGPSSSLDLGRVRSATRPKNFLSDTLVPAPSRICDDQSSRLRPLLVAVLLLFLFAILGDGTRATRLGNSGLWCRVPCTALGSSDTLVSQSEECGDSFHVMRGQLLQHLLITHPLAESGDDGSIRNTRYSPSYLGEAGDECLKSFPGFLPHCMEVRLHAMLLISTGEVHCEPRAELFPGVDRSWGEVHEPGTGWPIQGYMKICRLYSSVSTCCRNSGDVYLQEFRRV